MTAPVSTTDQTAEAPENGESRGELARRPLAAARRRFEGSWAEDLVGQLKALELGNWTVIFGAELLWSVLPLLILLSSLANERVDDDISRHIGVTGQGVRVIRELFRNSPTFSLVPILTGLLFALAGTITVVNSMQVLYERAFGQQRRGWRDIPRYMTWLAVLIAALVVEGTVSHPVRAAIGPVIEALVRFLAATLFFWWTMHFLLAGRVRWRALLRPAVLTALLWLALALFSSVSLSSSIVSDSRTYGTIGVVFTLLTWFVLIATVLVLGAAIGSVWERRSRQPPQTGEPADRVRTPDERRREERAARQTPSN